MSFPGLRARAVISNGICPVQVDHHRGKHRSAVRLRGSRRSQAESPRRLGHSVRHAHYTSTAEVPKLPERVATYWRPSGVLQGQHCLRSQSGSFWFYTLFFVVVMWCLSNWYFQLCVLMASGFIETRIIVDLLDSLDYPDGELSSGQILCVQ